MGITKISFKLMLTWLKSMTYSYWKKYKILSYTIRTIQLTGVIGGYAVTFIYGNYLFGIITSLFAISYAVSFSTFKPQKEKGLTGQTDFNHETPEVVSNKNELQLDVNMCSKLQVIPVLTEQLQSIIKQTDEAAEGLTSAFMGISRQAKKQVQAVQGIFGNLSEHTSDCNILLQTQENLKKLQTNFLALSSFIEKSIEMITGVLEEMKKIDAFAVNIVKIGKTTNILALNASIEAANTGDAGNGFKVIASEINALSKKSGESIREITEINEKLTSKVNAIKKELETVQNRSKSIGASTDELFTFTTGKINSTLQDTAEKIKGIATDAESLSKNISKVVVSIQFQDITRQRIEHVISPLEMLESDLSKVLTNQNNQNQSLVDLTTDSLMKQYTMESEREILKKFKNQVL